MKDDTTEGFANRPTATFKPGHGLTVNNWRNRGTDGEFTTTSIETSWKGRRGMEVPQDQRQLRRDPALAPLHSGSVPRTAFGALTAAGPRSSPRRLTMECLALAALWQRRAAFFFPLLHQPFDPSDPGASNSKRYRPVHRIDQLHLVDDPPSRSHANGRAEHRPDMEAGLVEFLLVRSRGRVHRRTLQK